MDDIFPDPGGGGPTPYWVKVLVIGVMGAISGTAWAVLGEESLISPTLLAFPVAAIIVSEHLRS